MPSAFRLFLIVATCATAGAGALVATTFTERAALAAMPLLAGLALLVHLGLRRPTRRKPRRDLEYRIADLFEQLQRERIESGNRITALEARISALESERIQVAEVQSQHLANLGMLRGALKTHQAELDAAIAGVGIGPIG
jgi:hypothetical protein